MHTIPLADLLRVPRQNLCNFTPRVHFISALWPPKKRERRGLVLAFDDRPRAEGSGGLASAGPYGFDDRIVKRAAKMARHLVIWAGDYGNPRGEFVNCLYRSCTVVLVVLTDQLHFVSWAADLTRWRRRDAIGWRIGEVDWLFHPEARHAAA
jgi:hypothetical protein